MSVADHPDLAERLAATMATYGASADNGEDRRTYYAERDAIFAEADRRDSPVTELPSPALAGNVVPMSTNYDTALAARRGALAAGATVTERPGYWLAEAGAERYVLRSPAGRYYWQLVAR